MRKYLCLLCTVLIFVVFIGGCAAAGYTKVVAPAITGVELSHRAGFRMLNITISNPYAKPIWVSLVCCPAYGTCPGLTSVSQKVYLKSRSDKVVTVFPDASQGSVTCYIEPY